MTNKPFYFNLLCYPFTSELAVQTERCAHMYSYKVTLVKGLVKRVEFWEEQADKTFCKIRVERISAQRFYSSGDWLGRGDASINVTKSIDQAVKDFPEDVVSKCVQAFNLDMPSLGDMLKIFPGAEVNFDLN